MSIRKGIYAVRDIVSTSIVSQLILELTDAPAIRAFHDALAESNSPMGKHPADYVLLDLGELDMDTGTIIGVTPLIIATGAAWLESQKGVTS